MNTKIKLFNWPKGKKATLLESFIIQKANSHNPPVREGKRKGDPIGFPLNKHVSSLLFIRFTILREVAKDAKVSYGLLRKWSAEPKFKLSTEEHRQEFVQYYLKHFESRIEKRTRFITDKFLKRSIGEIAIKAFPIPCIDEYVDIPQYNNSVLLDIYNAVYKIVDEYVKSSINPYSNIIKKVTGGKQVLLKGDIRKVRNTRHLSKRITGSDSIQYYSKVAAMSIEAELVLRLIGVSWDTHPSKRISNDYVFKHIPKSSAEEDISIGINRTRETAMALMSQAVDSLIINHYPLKGEYSKLALYINHHVNRTKY